MSKTSSPVYPVLAAYKKEEFINLIEDWGIDIEGKNILKTDLCEEAFGEDEILFSLSKESSGKSGIYAIDICEETVRQAKERMAGRDIKHSYMAADIRSIPLKDNAFDFVLSTSTLDHFENIGDFKSSLKELKRVLKPNGVMVIALHNIYNLNFYLSCKLSEFLKLNKYHTMFFRPQLARDIIKEIGMDVEKEAFIVHIPLPLNRLVVSLRILLPGPVIDGLARKLVSFFRSVGSFKKTNMLTGWFIAINCSKR